MRTSFARAFHESTILGSIKENVVLPSLSPAHAPSHASKQVSSCTTFDKMVPKFLKKFMDIRFYDSKDPLRIVAL